MDIKHLIAVFLRENFILNSDKEVPASLIISTWDRFMTNLGRLPSEVSRRDLIADLENQFGRRSSDMFVAIPGLQLRENHEELLQVFYEKKQLRNQNYHRNHRDEINSRAREKYAIKKLERLQPITLIPPLQQALPLATTQLFPISILPGQQVQQQQPQQQQPQQQPQQPQPPPPQPTYRLNTYGMRNEIFGVQDPNKPMYMGPPSPLYRTKDGLRTYVINFDIPVPDHISTFEELERFYRLITETFDEIQKDLPDLQTFIKNTKFDKDRHHPAYVTIIERSIPRYDLKTLSGNGYQILIKWLEEDIAMCQNVLDHQITPEKQLGTIKSEGQLCRITRRRYALSQLTKYLKVIIGPRFGMKK